MSVTVAIETTVESITVALADEYGGVAIGAGPTLEAAMDMALTMAADADMDCEATVDAVARALEAHYA